jgi:hypothetical protein
VSFQRQGTGSPDQRWMSAFPSQNQFYNTGHLRQHNLCRTQLGTRPSFSFPFEQLRRATEDRFISSGRPDRRPGMFASSWQVTVPRFLSKKSSGASGLAKNDRNPAIGCQKPAAGPPGIRAKKSVSDD